jgi:hypothetical protein
VSNSIELYVERDTFTPRSTLGKLYIAGKFECFTLEDTVRPAGVKVPGATAIPEGRYRVVIDFSVRFKRDMPHVLDVPGFDGIRIHCGNTPADTEGCLLLGTLRGADIVVNSRVAFDSFFPKLKGLLNMGEEVWVTYKNMHPKNEQMKLGLEAAA